MIREKIVMADEISRRTASSEDEVKRIACLVSGRWREKGEVKRGKEWKERGENKLIEVKRREVKVAQYDEWWAVNRKLAYQGVKFLEELSKGTLWHYSSHMYILYSILFYGILVT